MSSAEKDLSYLYNVISLRKKKEVTDKTGKKKRKIKFKIRKPKQ